MDNIFKAAKGPLDTVRVSKAVRQDTLVHRAGGIEAAQLENGVPGQREKSGGAGVVQIETT